MTWWQWTLVIIIGLYGIESIYELQGDITKERPGRVMVAHVVFGLLNIGLACVLYYSFANRGH